MSAAANDNSADQRRAEQLAGLWHDIWWAAESGAIGVGDAALALAPIRAEMRAVAERLAASEKALGGAA